MASNNTSAAASGGVAKKGKMKGKTVDLTEFLNKPINWAEEMEELSLTPADPEHSAGYGGDYSSSIDVRTEINEKRSRLPTAPKAALATGVDVSRVPLDGPFSAYIGNVAYDATDNDVERLFKDLKVVEIRLMRDGSRVKGYGYVEFATREDLIVALGMNKEKMLNRELKIDLAVRQSEQNQRQGYGSGRGSHQQRSGYDQDKSRDREQETSGDWRMNARGPTGPPSPYGDDRRSQPRATGPAGRSMQPPGQPGYGYPPPPPHGYGPPPYGPPAGYGRRPPIDDYSAQQYGGRPSGYESDYGRGYGGGYDGYPMMRQASYSSQYSGYASDRESTGGHYRRGQQGSAGYYGSMRRDYRGGRQPGQQMGGDRYHGVEAYGMPPYQGYQQPHYNEGYGARDSFRQQRPRGGHDNRMGLAGTPRDQYGYDQSYGGGPGRRSDDRVSSADTLDSNDPAANRPKERPRLALQPRSLPPPNATSPEQNATAETTLQDGQKQEQPATSARPRTSVSSAEVFGGARPVDTSAKEREIEERLRKQSEEFRKQGEERKSQQSHERVRKSSSSNFVSEREGNAGRRRTSDSQSSAAGGYSKGSGESSARNDEDEQAHGQVKILQRSNTIPSEVAGGGASDRENRLQSQNAPLHPAPPPSQNVWTSQSHRRGGQMTRSQEENSGASSEQPSSKSVDRVSEEIVEQSEQDNETPSSIRRRAGSQSKSSEADPESRRSQDDQQDDAVFKPQHPRHPQHQRGRGGRGRGSSHYQHQHDLSSLPPRFARERDQQDFAHQGSNPVDDGQDQYSDKRRPSKEIVIRRGGQGTLNPTTGSRRGGPAGSGRPSHQRTGSREREYYQRGNGRRYQQNAQQRRGSADSGLPQPQQDETQAAQKPPTGPRRQQQPAHAPGSRKSSATPAAVLADPPPVSFESKNKFEMLDMEDD